MYNYEVSQKLVDIPQRSFHFGVRIVKLVLTLSKDTAGLAIGQQVIRSGTSVGANIEESQNAGTRKDFIRGLTISLKEARETEYWLRLIAETNIINISRLKDLLTENKEIIKILTSIIKKAKQNS